MDNNDLMIALYQLKPTKTFPIAGSSGVVVNTAAFKCSKLDVYDVMGNSDLQKGIYAKGTFICNGTPRREVMACFKIPRLNQDGTLSIHCPILFSPSFKGEYPLTVVNDDLKNWLIQRLK